MANTIKIKHSDTDNAVPPSLEAGELAINRRNKKLFYTDHTDTVQEMDLAAVGGSGVSESFVTAMAVALG